MTYFLKEGIRPMCHLCSLRISQGAYISKFYSDTAGHIYRQALQQRRLSKRDHMKTSSCILRRPDDGIMWLVFRSKSET